MNASATLAAIAANISRVITGQAATVRLLLAAYAAGGHVLIEDYPGTGKTSLAKALARSMAVDFRRIQFTPDLLPTDILGVSIYDPHSQTFKLHRGPIFTTILLADEINRASPRTQSALLEAMGENQVSIEGTSLPLDPAFFVIATQNPVEFHGTYPLPEAQLDRFALRLALGYVSAADEVRILETQTEGHPLDRIGNVATAGDLVNLRERVARVRVADEIKRYIVDLVGGTRHLRGVTIGASPRASLTLMKCAQALALHDRLEYVTPDHVQELIVPVLAHRLALDPEARFSGSTPVALIDGLVRQIPVPR
jgi:MoxR-like ATPase